MHFIKLNFVENNEFDAITNRWWLDQPKQGAISIEDDTIDLSGWIICNDTSAAVCVVVESSAGEQEEYPLNIKRADAIKSVLGKDSNFNCGFKVKLKLKIGTIGLSFKINTKTYHILTLSITRSIKVLKGRNNFLFLANDTNRSTDQFTGTISISPKALSDWTTHLQSLNKEYSADGGRACFLLAPAKEEIFPDFYPHLRATITPIDEFISNFNGRLDILFPRDVLRRDRELTYSRVDSHWTDYGAKLAAEEILRYFGLSDYISRLPKEFEVRSTTGDLGIKTAPPTFGPVLSISARHREVSENFNNRVNNNGRIRVYENPEAAIHQTLVIFGDSFSTNLSRLLTPIFSRVVYTYTGAGLDKSVADFEKPKFIVAQSNQRFIITPPPLEYNIWENAKSKLIQEDEGILESLASEMQAHLAGSSHFYAKRMLDLVEEIISDRNNT